MTEPQVLRPDNFTPPTRTPWGGDRLLRVYKPFLDLGAGVAGEAWEVSVEPDFPSRVQGSGATLRSVIAAAPEPWLGRDVSQRFGGQSPLLVKLLDTADNLSVQVHPGPEDPALGPDESGKPESWIVLAAEEGSGIFLGFRQGVTRRDVEACIRDGGRLDAMLNFVPAQRGDTFVIDAGTVHAIGAGVTMIEPQHVSPGRRGLTYRFWDWNRLYDARGRLDPRGAARELHVERSLAVTRWDGPQGADFVESCRSQATVLVDGPLCRARLLSTPFFEAERWLGTGQLVVPTPGAMVALTCVRGRAQINTPGGAVALSCGYSAVVPADASLIEVDADDVEVYASWSVVR